MKISFTTVVFTCAVMLTACAAPEQQGADIRTDRARLVWPTPPAKPRLQFVRAFSSPEDLGIGRSFVQQLKALISGTSQVRLVRPMAVLEADDGVLYVADPGIRGVHRFDIRNSAYKTIQSTTAGSMLTPVALAVGPLSEVFVSDSRLRKVFMIEPGSDEAQQVELQVPLSQPTGLAVDQVSGRLYVVDTTAHHVKIFARDGALLQQLGRRGSGPGEFNYPTMAWLNKIGELLVVDTLNFRVQVFDTSGRFLRMFGNVGASAGFHAQPKGIATDGDGHIYVVDSLLNRLQLFDTEGEFLLKVGQRGIDRGEFWLPAGIFITKENKVYLADSYNGRIQVFQYLGGQTP